jgi:aminoglycoside 6'-N-acetyltransferase I
MSKIIKEEYGKSPYYEKWTYGNANKTFSHFSKVGLINVAIINNKVVGFIIFRKEYYNKGYSIIIEELVVEKKLQGKGIGKSLMKEVENYCKKQKIKDINLTTNKKAPAYKFYLKLGYIPSNSTVYFQKTIK